MHVDLPEAEIRGSEKRARPRSTRAWFSIGRAGGRRYSRFTAARLSCGAAPCACPGSVDPIARRAAAEMPATSLAKYTVSSHRKRNRRPLSDDLGGNKKKRAIANGYRVGWLFPRSLQVRHQAHEAFILMVLMMAMQQRWPGIIGDKVDFHATESCHVDRVFHDAGCRLVADLRHLERVTMQMDRMIVAALVGHDEAVALAEF